MTKLDLQELKVTQFHFYRTDELPYAHLNTKLFVSSIMEAFSFQSNTPLIVQNDVGPGYDFFGGAIKEGSKVIPIQQFRFEPLRLSFVVVGDSDDAKLASDAVVAQIQKIDPAFKSSPMTLQEQTTCIAKLNIDFRDLFDARLIAFLEESTRQVAHAKGNDEAIVEPRVFRACIRTPDKNNKGHNIGGETLITIEPRVGTELSEHRFFISAPVSSDELIQLVEKFEKLFKKTTIS